METVIDRLDKYLKSKNINDNQFTVKTGISQGWIGKSRINKSNSLQVNTRDLIKKAFKDLNMAWLLTGEGEMLKGDSKLDIKGSGVSLPELIKELRGKEEEIKRLKEELLELHRELRNKK